MGKKSRIAYLIPVCFLFILVGIGGLNAKAVLPLVEEKLALDEGYLKEGGSQLEEDYRTFFWKQREWVNLYGMIQNAMGKRLSGNMRFIRTDSGLMDYVTKESDVYPFAEEMLELKQVLDEKGVPLLYVQMPVREPEESSEPDILIRTRTYYSQIREITDAAGILCMDEEEILEGEEAPSRDEFYFKTDVHTTTQGEIWMANKIAEKLESEYRVAILDVIQEEDERFEIHSHPFAGNLVQSLGVYYVGIDEFEEYIPKEQPTYHLEDVFGGWYADGKYEEVIMNGYDQSSEDETYTYWITNYLRYGVGGYHVENLDSDGPSLLVICDSLCYRTLSYLSLECKNITVIDPRFIPADGTDYVKKALEDKMYDAAIYLHGTFYTTDHSMFGQWSLQEDN